MSPTCSLCPDPAASIVVDNLLRDPDTLRVMGGPVALDDEGDSTVGNLLCPHHADYADSIGYTVERLGDSRRLDAAVLAHRADPNPDSRALLDEAARLYREDFYGRQTIEFITRTKASL